MCIHKVGMFTCLLRPSLSVCYILSFAKSWKLYTFAFFFWILFLTLPASLLLQNITNSNFQEALRDLWNAAFPNVKLQSLISEQWKDMGWQGANPSTDFRSSLPFKMANVLSRHVYTFITFRAKKCVKTSGKEEIIYVFNCNN